MTSATRSGLRSRTAGRRQGEVTCPVCRREVPPGALDAATTLSPELAEIVQANAPGWHPRLGLCADCVRRFRHAERQLGALARGGGPPILPTPLRLGAIDRFRGRDVTIAFLDSGFSAHPDLVQPADRIVAYADVTEAGGRRRRADLDRPDVSSWHGTMTSVVACGNGHLSEGLYRGVASEARLALVKCGTASRITHDDLRKGLEWVIRHRDRYGIRIVNVSCGGDYEASYLQDGLSQAAERATHEGLLVCAAAGNLGHAPGHPVLPPASAPSVLTVGGLDDKNRLAFAGFEPYHSSYGPTIDGLQKPEVLAPGIWVAAPILAGSSVAAQAQLLFRLQVAPDGDLRPILEAFRGVDGDLDAAAGLDPVLIRKLVMAKIESEKLVSGAYKHVDGTSFAAPIVSSVVAQMLEANPRLTPQQLKRTLIATARRIAALEVDRQGWGVIDAEKAVLAALAAQKETRKETKT
ncbi:MAG TPA: S8 family serine peptidase [Vicinamibacteria bacterium]